MNPAVFGVASIEVSAAEFLRLSQFERFDDGSGYRCSVEVQSGEFGCSRRVFIFDDLSLFVQQLRQSFESLEGTVILKQRYETEAISLTSVGRGHFKVSVYLTNYLDNTLKLALEVDQTQLRTFLADLEAINALFQA